MATAEARLDIVVVPPQRGRMAPLARLGRRHPTAALGLLLLVAMTAMAALAPWLGTIDPVQIDPVQRLRPPSAGRWFGTDMYGRDVYSRTVYGGPIPLFGVSRVTVLGGRR